MTVAAPVKEAEASTAQKPVESFRLRGVSASIFANHVKSEGRDRTFHKVSLQRHYKDGEEWKQTTSFSRDDLPVLATLIERSWNYILDAESSRGKEDDGE